MSPPAPALAASADPVNVAGAPQWTEIDDLLGRAWRDDGEAVGLTDLMIPAPPSPNGPLLVTNLVRAEGALVGVAL